ncbi:nucleoside triphosphate pyrophosphatase [Sphingomonas sp.]|uniref:Maf family protein n=1 Tax=Sphingomonas sp. TaxID=28214 RepID=UPI001D42237D|nr:nucleoside triphosphate pyrophosphatase [Sphingomonas sp.]MBX9797379.1 Maf family protein [Sphingomonas sp.]
MKLVLASASPRRRDLLARLGVTPYRIAAPDIDETPRRGEQPRTYVERMAREKALAVPRAGDELVLAGDTTVAAGRRILGKAESADEVRAMLALLSGRRHQCLTALCLVGPDGRPRLRLSASTIAFKQLSAAEIDAYVDSGEGLGKAGGYAIQGRAEALIRWMQGSYSGIVGLPLFEARALLTGAGYRCG